MRSIGRLVVLAAVGLVVLLATCRAEGEHDHEHCEAEGVGCPLPDGHEHAHLRVLDEEDHAHDIDYHITLSSDRPRGVPAGKVVGFRMRIPHINDWHWHDDFGNDVEEVLVGFKFPVGDHHDHRQLKAFNQEKTKPFHAMAGGSDEHEHSPFLFRNYNVKPKLGPKKANRAHIDLDEGILDWHLEEDMTYRAAHSFLMFGKVDKEWEEPLIEVHAFIKNATGCNCWEGDIKVAVLKGPQRPKVVA